MPERSTRRVKRGLRELAEALNYTPGEFALTRMSEDATRLSGWVADMARGLKPADLAHLSKEEARSLVAAEAAALMRQEKDWADYFHPKLRSSDLSVSGDPDKPLVLNIVRHGNNDPR